MNDLTPISILFTDEELTAIVLVLPDNIAIEDWLKIEIMGLVGRILTESEDE